MCTNVTVQTSSLSPDAEDEVEVICLLEGEHEHVSAHPGQNVLVTVESGSTVYANATQAAAGDTTLFTHGECEDVLFRFAADTAEPWLYPGHNCIGPWPYMPYAWVGDTFWGSCTTGPGLRRP